MKNNFGIKCRKIKKMIIEACVILFRNETERNRNAFLKLFLYKRFTMEGEKVIELRKVTMAEPSNQTYDLENLAS